MFSTQNMQFGGDWKFTLAMVTCALPSRAQVNATRRLYRPPDLPDTRRCSAWSFEAETSATATSALTNKTRSMLSALAAHWLKPWATTGVNAAQVDEADASGLAE